MLFAFGICAHAQLLLLLCPSVEISEAVNFVKSDYRPSRVNQIRDHNFFSSPLDWKKTKLLNPVFPKALLVLN